MPLQIMRDAQILAVRDRALSTIRGQLKLWGFIAAVMMLVAHWLGWHKAFITQSLPVEQYGLTIAFTTFAITSLSFVISGVCLLVSLAIVEKKNGISLQFASIDIGLLGIYEMTKPLTESEFMIVQEKARCGSLAECIINAAEAEQRSIRKFELEAVLNEK